MIKQDLENLISELELDKRIAKRRLAETRRAVTEAETKLIDISIAYDRAKEELRVFIATSPIREKTLHDLEIDKFREDNPEIVEFARKRDEHKE